jgi:hypothetical protein
VRALTITDCLTSAAPSIIWLAPSCPSDRQCAVQQIFVPRRVPRSPCFVVALVSHVGMGVTRLRRELPCQGHPLYFATDWRRHTQGSARPKPRNSAGLTNRQTGLQSLSLAVHEGTDPSACDGRARYGRLQPDALPGGLLTNVSTLPAALPIAPSRRIIVAAPLISRYARVLRMSIGMRNLPVRRITRPPGSPRRGGSETA